MHRLKDKTAIITGAGRGIGRGIAQVCSEDVGATTRRDVSRSVSRPAFILPFPSRRAGSPPVP